MLDKPNIPDEIIAAGVREEYGLRAGELAFLPIGADVNTAVYRLTAGGAAYFLKLRSGPFDEAAVAVPQFLAAQGIRHVIPPLETGAGRLWGGLGAYKMVLYPLILGEDGYHAALLDRQWVEFGAAIRGIHAAKLPAEIERLIRREDYSPRWREAVTAFQAMVEGKAFEDPAAANLAAFMQAKRAAIGDVVARARHLARRLQARPLESVLCHADIHPGNLLIVAGGDEFYIVDWDTLLYAPKERDLMFIGGGISGGWSDRRVEALFYEGYGNTEVDRTALAYYRFERIVEDFAAYGEQLLLSNGGGDDRQQGYQFFASNFLPGSTIDIAYRTIERQE